MTEFFDEKEIASFYPLTSSPTRSAHLLLKKCALLDREVRTSLFRARNEGFCGIFLKCQNLSFFDHKNEEDFSLVLYPTFTC